MRLIMMALVALALTNWSAPAAAQSDEIQVYDGGLAPVGTFNLTWHNNYTFRGTEEAPTPVGLPVNHELNGVTEWAYGVTPWFEAGLYLPLYSVGHGHVVMNGYKLRALFARPEADKHRFVYGVNFEFSQNNNRWDEKRTTSEVRPIIGWHVDRWDIIFNPIVDTDYTGGVSNLEFVPSTRIAYKTSERFSVAVEEYADYGPLGHLVHGSEQAHQLYGVVDYAGKKFEIEGGLGFGLTRSSDDLVGKLIVSFDLN